MKICIFCGANSSTDPEVEKKAKEVEKYLAAKNKEDRESQIKRAEEEWRKTLSKVQKNWLDKFLISTSGIKDEKTLQIALDKAKKESDDILSDSEKKQFFRFLVNMIVIFD